MWNAGNRAWKCGEQQAMLQTSPVMSLFSEVDKPDWPRKKIGQFLRPVTNCPHDQLEQWVNAYECNVKVCSMPINNDHM